MTEQLYINQLIKEKATLDPKKSENTIRLLEDEIYRAEIKSGKLKSYAAKDPKDGEKIVYLKERIYVPVNDFPFHNFVGKLLGPKGHTLKYIQETTNTKIAILGKGSMRNKLEEEELLKSDMTMYAHLKEPLHILIFVIGYKEDAEKRMAHAKDVITQFMDPTNFSVWTKKMNQGLINTDANVGSPAGMRAPIIRVGVPPPGAVVLSGQPATATSRVNRYTYDASYDGTYEGYPSTADALCIEPVEPVSGSKRKPISVEDDSPKRSKDSDGSDDSYDSSSGDSLYSP